MRSACPHCPLRAVPPFDAFFLSASFAPGYSFRACVSSGASTDRRASPFPPSRSRKLEEDPEYAKMMWARNQKEMMQTDEVSMRLYSELDLIDAPAGASRGSQKHIEMVSGAVKKAMEKDRSAAAAADKDVFKMMRTKSDADLAEVGLKRVDSGVPAEDKK